MEKNGKHLPDFVAYAVVKTDKIGDDGYPIRRRTRYGVAFDNRNSEGKGPITLRSDLMGFDLELWPPFNPEDKKKDGKEAEPFESDAEALEKPPF